MAYKRPDQGEKYRIKVKGTLAAGSLDWFSGLAITPLEDGGTLLVGWFPDQPALRGLLDQLWNLNFTIQSLEQIETENQHDASRGRR